MELPQRIQAAARKENIPPALSCYGAPKEERRIQKNINAHLLLSSGSHLGELWTQTGSSIHRSSHLGENVGRDLRVPSGRKETSGLFQTNLFCPPVGLAKTSLVQQQTNLEFNLQSRRWAGGTLKRTPLRGFPERPRNIPRNSSRMKNREGEDNMKGQHELFTGSRRSYEDLKARRECSSPGQFSPDPSLHSSPSGCPLPMTFSGISDSSPPGPALTLDSLVDGHSSPEEPQTPIRSSQNSADRCWSLQGLKKERPSFSWESRSPSWVPQPAREPQISTLAVRKVRSSVEGSFSGQVRSKWGTMLSSTLLTCQEDDSSCLRSSSGTPPSTNKKATLNESRDQGYLKTLDLEEHRSGTFCGSELYLKKLLPDIFFLKNLESSLKMCVESSPNRRLSVEDTHEEKPPTLDPSGVPEVLFSHPLEKNVGDFVAHEVGDKHGEAGGDPTITSTADEASLFTALQKVRLFEETIWKGPRKRSQLVNIPVWPWRHQKDGVPLQGHFVPQETKKLGDIFKRWRSLWEKRQQICLLTFRIQTRLIGRCFKAWQSLAQRKQHSQAAVAHLRARSLRASFRQWGLMVQARKNAKMAVIELLGTKRLSSRGPRRAPDRRTWPPKYVGNTLDSLFHLRALQEAFLAWEARCQEAQQAGAFRHGLTLRQLREALGQWHRRTRSLNPLGLIEGSLLASADLQASSSSSALTTASQEIQLVEPSLIGLTYLGTFEEPSGLPAPASRCPNCSFDRENPTHVANRASPLRLNWQAASKYGRLWKRKVQLRHFQGVRDARQLAEAWLLWKDACRTEVVIQTL
ncbi:uncharacterized protein LOC113428790, partial [Notechis scutatus]|uniref:Uncharacterized protein LOC113428790 n=1 Tax=Notechis scutatus TaxID=8663 RepID=A0A6J1VVJ1_9SAUR